MSLVGVTKSSYAVGTPIQSNESIDKVDTHGEIHIKDVRSWSQEQWELLKAQTQHYKEVCCLIERKEILDCLDGLTRYLNSLDNVKYLQLSVELLESPKLLLKYLPRYVKHLVLQCTDPPHTILRKLCGDLDLMPLFPPWIMCHDVLRHCVPGLAVPYGGGWYSAEKLFALFHCAMPSLSLDCDAKDFIFPEPQPQAVKADQDLGPYGVMLKYGSKAMAAPLPCKAKPTEHPLWQRFFSTNLINCVPWGQLKLLSDTWNWLMSQTSEPSILYPAFDLLKFNMRDVYRRGSLVAKIGCYAVVKTESTLCECDPSVESLFTDTHAHTTCGIPLHYEIFHLADLQPSISAIKHPDLARIRESPLSPDETVLFPSGQSFDGLMLLGVVRDVKDNNTLLIAHPNGKPIRVHASDCERYVCFARNASPSAPPFFLGCPRLGKSKTRGTPKSRASRFDFSWLASSHNTPVSTPSYPDVIGLCQYQQLCCVSPSVSEGSPMTQRPVRKSARLSAQRAQASIALLAKAESPNELSDHPMSCSDSQDTEEENEAPISSTHPSPIVRESNSYKSQIFRTSKEGGRPLPPLQEKPPLTFNGAVASFNRSMKSNQPPHGTDLSALRGVKRPSATSGLGMNGASESSSGEKEDCLLRPLSKRRKRDTFPLSAYELSGLKSKFKMIAAGSEYQETDGHTDPCFITISDSEQGCVKEGMLPGQSALTTVASQTNSGPNGTNEGSSRAGSGLQTPEDCPELSPVDDRLRFSQLREQLVSSLSFLATLGIDVVGSTRSGRYHRFVDLVSVSPPPPALSRPPQDSPGKSKSKAAPKPSSTRSTTQSVESIMSQDVCAAPVQADMLLSESPRLMTEGLSESAFNSSPAASGRAGAAQGDQETSPNNYSRHYSSLYSRYPQQFDLFYRNRQGRRLVTFDPMFSKQSAPAQSTGGIRTRRQTREKGGCGRPDNGISNITHSPSAASADKLESLYGPAGSIKSLEAFLNGASSSGGEASCSKVPCLSGNAVTQILNCHVLGHKLAADQSIEDFSALSSVPSEAHQLSSLIKLPTEKSDKTVRRPRSAKRSSESNSNDDEMSDDGSTLLGLCPCSRLMPISFMVDSAPVTLINFDGWRHRQTVGSVTDSNVVLSMSSRLARENPSDNRRRPSQTPRLSPSHCRGNKRDHQEERHPANGFLQYIPPRAEDDESSKRGPFAPALSKTEITQLRQRLKVLFERLGSSSVQEPNKILEVSHAVASACAHLVISKKLSTTEFLAIVSVPKLIADRTADLSSPDESHNNSLTFGNTESSSSSGMNSNLLNSATAFSGPSCDPAELAKWTAFRQASFEAQHRVSQPPQRVMAGPTNKIFNQASRGLAAAAGRPATMSDQPRLNPMMQRPALNRFNNRDLLWTVENANVPLEIRQKMLWKLGVAKAPPQIANFQALRSAVNSGLAKPNTPFSSGCRGPPAFPRLNDQST